MKKMTKKYNPQKEVAKITATMVGTSVGVNVVGNIGGLSPHTPASIYTAAGMMGTIPLVQTSGIIMKSFDMLNPPKKRRKRK